jgi:hypothetical protein
MITKWIHLLDLVGDPWILPIWKEANDYVARNPTVPELPKRALELGIHISTRLNILTYIKKRLNEGTAKLFTKIKKDHKSKHVFTQLQEGSALPVDDDRKYGLLADIDALIFELNSVYELMAELFQILHKYVEKPIKKGEVRKKIKRILRNDGHDTKWCEKLSNHRKFLIHRVAPYLAVDLSHEPEKYELLVMKNNLHAFDNPREFFTLSELITIDKDFKNAKLILQKYLKSLFINSGVNKGMAAYR